MISKQAQEFWSLLKRAPKQSSCRLLRGARPANTRKTQLRNPLESASQLLQMSEVFGLNHRYLHSADPRQPLASPVFADLTGLPPLLCLVGGDEILLDDTIRLVRNAGIAGVDATAFIAAGMQHVFPIWAGIFPEAEAAIVLIGNWVRARTGNSA